MLFDDKIQLIESDVSFATRTKIIMDAHTIPIDDSSIDGILLQAVLEHVVYPSRVIKECERVIKMGGLIYVSTSFIQQVHMR
ncbi:MAG: hypothetical protein STSR0008_14110 [Ignavibacterium sp.]